MKTLKRTVVQVVLSLLLCCTLFGCSGREKTDLSVMKNLSELNGSNAIIAAQTDTFHLDALRNQVTGIEVKDYDTFSLLLTALNSGSIDGYVAEEPTAWSVCAKDDTLTYLPFVNNETGFKATDADVGVAVAFATGSDKVATANTIIAKVTEENRVALMKQMVKITENPDTQLNETLAVVSSSTDTSKGVLKIAMECDYQPYNWTQTSDANGAVPIANGKGYANGYDVQMAKYIAAEMGMALEIYSYKWDGLIPAVQSGAVDGIIAGMSPTAEREEEVDFTDCYWTSNLVLIIKK